MVWMILGGLTLAIVGTGAYLKFGTGRGDVYERATRLASAGEYTDARSMVRSQIERDPNNAQAHAMMAKIFRMEGKVDGELYHLLEIRRSARYGIGIKPNEILNRIGQIYYQQERFQESFEAYLESSRYAATDEVALAHLAFMAIGQSGFETAETFFRNLTNIAPTNTKYHVGRAIGLSMMKKKEALEEFDEAIRLNSKDPTPRFFAAFTAWKLNQLERSLNYLVELKDITTDNFILYIAHRLLTVVNYLLQDYHKAFESARHSRSYAAEEGLEREEFDASISAATMAIHAGDLESANEILLELEVENPTDETIQQLSDFRMDLEEGNANLHEADSRGFQFQFFLKDWMRQRFPDDTVYRLSGLQMSEKFDLDALVQSGKGGRRPIVLSEDFDVDALVDQFLKLPDEQFRNICEKILLEEGYKTAKEHPVAERDGFDIVAVGVEDRKQRALFRIRKWRDQPISDIFLRDMQNRMNDLKVTHGYVIASAKLTGGAQQALENLKKITVINEEEFGKLLYSVLEEK